MAIEFEITREKTTLKIQTKILYKIRFANGLPLSCEVCRVGFNTYTIPSRQDMMTQHGILLINLMPTHL